jgi:deoxycytidine triphosphate deaminase
MYVTIERMQPDNEVPMPSCGVFSDIEIKAALKNGHIVISPFRTSQLRGSSYDLTIGPYFYSTDSPSNKKFYNPFDPSDVARYFKGPFTASTHSEFCRQNGLELFKGIPRAAKIIVLRPGERILAHTQEFIGINPPGTTEMRARSSWGRNGVAMCFDAGWGDPGYINRWTMEVFNLNQHESVVIPVGMRVSQLVFHHTGPVESHYGDSGKYQAGRDIKKLIKHWRPEDMLPRAFKDKVPVK